jgi:hypothetical protein
MPSNAAPSSPSTTTLPWLTHGGTLTAGAAVGGLIAANWGTISAFIDSQNLHVKSTWSLLAILAGIGALGGGLNAYIVSQSIVLPRIRRVDGKLTLTPGILGNLLAGALGAVVTVWMATPAEAADPDQQKNLLTGARIAAAFMAGWAGAHLLEPRDKDGQPVASPLPNVDPAATVSLRALLAPEKLNEHFRALALVGMPVAIGPDGAGLRVEALNAAQRLDPRLLAQVKDLRIADVGTRSQEAFLAGLSLPPGQDVAANQALDEVRLAAHRAKELLDRIPADAPLKPS